MPLKLYMDVHVPYAISKGLRLHGVDVVNAQEDARNKAADEDLLLRATELGRAMFSQDTDLLRIAADFQIAGRRFCGVIFAHQGNLGYGLCIERLLLLSLVYEDGDLDNRVEFL